MDDYTSNVLNESHNKWSTMLMTNLTPHIINGFKSIFNESIELCNNNQEFDKYLMTFQNLLSRIPKWNQTIIDNERKRIINVSKCSYLEDLITCVHIIQLKILSCVRVGSEDKKININIPDFNTFLHKTYINIARKLYCNIYLFQVDVTPLEQQKYNREFEILVQTSIMNTIDDNLPVEELLRKYMDETQEIVHKHKEEFSIEQDKPIEQDTPIEQDKPIEEVTIEDTNTIEETNPIEEYPIEENTNEEVPITENLIDHVKENNVNQDIIQNVTPDVIQDVNNDDNESLMDENYLNELITPRNNRISFESNIEAPIKINEPLEHIENDNLELDELDIEEL